MFKDNLIQNKSSLNISVLFPTMVSVLFSYQQQDHSYAIITLLINKHIVLYKIFVKPL